MKGRVLFVHFISILVIISSQLDYLNCNKGPLTSDNRLIKAISLDKLKTQLLNLYVKKENAVDFVSQRVMKIETQMWIKYNKLKDDLKMSLEEKSDTQ